MLICCVLIYIMFGESLRIWDRIKVRIGQLSRPSEIVGLDLYIGNSAIRVFQVPALYITNWKLFGYT